MKIATDDLCGQGTWSKVFSQSTNSGHVSIAHKSPDDMYDFSRRDFELSNPFFNLRYFY